MYLSSSDEIFDGELNCKSQSNSPPTTFSIDSILSQKMLHQQAEKERLSDLSLVTYETAPKPHHTEQVVKYRPTEREKGRSSYPGSPDLNNNDIEYDSRESRKEENEDFVMSSTGLRQYRERIHEEREHSTKMHDERSVCYCDSCYPTKSKSRCKVQWVYSDSDIARSGCHDDRCYYPERRFCDSRGQLHSYYEGPMQQSYSRNSDNEDKGLSKRRRTIFTASQLERLEFEFQQQQYIVGQERRYLARELGLNEIQVKVWFQNRRIKWRKYTHTHDIETVLVGSS